MKLTFQFQSSPHPNSEGGDHHFIAGWKRKIEKHMTCQEGVFARRVDGVLIHFNSPLILARHPFKTLQST